jgi:lysophospholipase L1-like esterase
MKSIGWQVALVLMSPLAFPFLGMAGEEAIKLKKGDRIIFLGDSITQQGAGPKGYVSLIKNVLAEMQKDLGIEVIGAGVSGNKVPDLQKRLDRDVLMKKPTLVVIYIGINDVWHGENNPKNGTPKDKFEEGLKDIITKIKAAGANVLLCTPTVIGEKTGGGNKLDAQLDEYSAISRKLAKEMEVPLCDLRKAFLDYLKENNADNKEKGLLTGDRVHLNEAGNRLVAEVMLKALGIRRPNLTIGKDTTYFMGPVDKDGRINYVAAVNEVLRKGVTPENNATVLLWRALGPHPDGATMPPEFFELLGIAALPDKGNYFVDALKYMKTHHKVNTQNEKESNALFTEMEVIQQRPWTAKQHPRFAGWIKDNEKPLALVAQAAKLSQYYSPLVPPKSDKNNGGLMGVLLPGVQKCRGLGSALVIRAMLRIEEGNYTEAWQDLLACHRLGSFVGQGGTLIENLVGIAIDSLACAGDVVFLDRAKLDSKQLMACLDDVQKLPPLSPWPTW